ncbi:CASP-like protein 4D1, partial [Cucurbita argyrosperma subsp. argyrosperma]
MGTYYTLNDSYRYMLATIIVGVVFNLLQIAFSLFNIVKNRNGTILFDFFGDKFLSYLLATSTAAGFGVSVDLQRTKDPEDLFGTFFGKAYATSALLLFAFFCSAAVSILSSFAFSKRP